MSLASRGLTPGFLPLAEAAQWSGVSPKTMKRWIAKGLPVYQSGPRSKVLIRPSDIETFLTKRQVAKPELDAMVEATLGELRGTGS